MQALYIQTGSFPVRSLRRCGVPVASCCGSGQFSDAAASSVLTVAAATKRPAPRGGFLVPCFWEQEAEGRLHRDGCVAGDRRTPGRINTGGEKFHLLRQPLSLPFCLRCSSGSTRKSLYAVSGGTRKFLFISSSLHHPVGVCFLLQAAKLVEVGHPFGVCFLLQAAKLVEVGRFIAVPSLDEGSCDGDPPDQAPKLVKFVNTAVGPPLDKGWCDDEARTPRCLRRTKAGVLKWYNLWVGPSRQGVSVTRVGFVRRVLTPWLGPVVIYLSLSTSGWLPTAKSDADETGREVRTPNLSLFWSRSPGAGWSWCLGLPSLLFRVCLSSRSCVRSCAVLFGVGFPLVCFARAQRQGYCCTLPSKNPVCGGVHTGDSKQRSAVVSSGASGGKA